MRFPIFIVLSCAALCNGCASLDKQRPEWLPSTARVIFSSHWEDGFLGDATLKLKARITEAEFGAVVERLQLAPHTADRRYPDPPQWIGDDDPRWDPPRSLSGAFVRFEGRWFQIAKYERGFLYYQSARY
jgi:hypothetical protein